ncbi:MAG TPA: PEGA domain-containing protein [bacterium]|nr:PEGA domain-containing protein [bacterium]
MLRNKWFMGVVIALAVLVLAWQLIPFIVERVSRHKGPSETNIAKTAVQTAPELDVEVPTRDVGLEVSGQAAASAVSAVARPGEAEAKWMGEFAAASRDTSRSPFQRKYEGLGKIFIRSRPGGAEIYINNTLMPKQTDWLVPVSFPAGKYLVELRKEGYNPYVTDLVVPEGFSDFEEITTINAALRKKPEASAQQVQRNLLYVRGEPPVRVAMIMHSGKQSWAVIQRLPLSEGIKWVVTEGEDIQFSTPTGGPRGAEEVSQRIRIIRILPEVVTIRNLLINLDYDFPIGGTWGSETKQEAAAKS